MTNGYVGRHIDEFYIVYGGYDASQRNVDRRMLPLFFLWTDVCVLNAWNKRELRRR